MADTGNAYLNAYYADDDENRRRLLASQPPEPAPGTETSPTDPQASAPVKRTSLATPSPQPGVPQDNPLPGMMPDFQRLYPAHRPANLQSLPTPDQFGLGARQQAAGGFEVFKNPLIWIGILGSLLTRRPALAAMTFAGAAMKGYDAGETETFEKNKIKFDEAVKQVEAQNRIELERYKEIWENDQEKNWQGNLPKLWAEAAKNGDKTMMQLLQIGAPMEQIEKYMIQKGEQGNRLTEQLALKAAERQIPKPDDPKWLASPPGQAWIKQQPPDQQEQYQRFAEEHTALAPLKPGQIPPQMTQQQFDVAADYWRTTGKHMQLGFGKDMNAIKLQVENHALQRQSDGVPIDKAAKELAAQQAGYAGQVSGARAFGTRAVNIETAANLSAYAIPQALEASDAFPRGKWQPINAGKLRLAEAGSNVALSDWDVKNLQIVEMYARALNPQGQTIRQDMFERSLSVISQARSPQAYEAVLRSIYDAIQKERQGLAVTGEEIKTGKPAELPDPFAGRKDPRKTEKQKADDGWGELTVH